MGERPLEWVQVMPLAAPGMGSKADAGLAARKYEGNLPPPALNCRTTLDWIREGACPHMVFAQVASGSREAPVSRKRRREIEFELELGFPGFGKV
jgi:hypothetical protein